jgi:hypothetical protein
MKTVWKLLFAVTLAQVAFAAVALAQAAGVPLTDNQAGDTAQQFWNLVVNKNYALALGPGITLLVWALRKWDKNIPKVGPAIDAFLNQPFVAFLLPTVIAAAGGAGTALAAHKPAVDVLGAIFQAAMSAVFAYVGAKKLGEQVHAGDAGAAAVDSKQAAIDAMKKAAADEAAKTPPAGGAS